METSGKHEQRRNMHRRDADENDDIPTRIVFITLAAVSLGETRLCLSLTPSMLPASVEGRALPKQKGRSPLSLLHEQAQH